MRCDPDKDTDVKAPDEEKTLSSEIRRVALRFGRKPSYIAKLVFGNQYLYDRAKKREGKVKKDLKTLHDFEASRAKEEAAKKAAQQ